MRRRNGQHRNIHLMSRHPRVKLLHRLHENAVHIDADQRGRHIKHRLHIEALLRETGIIRHRAADIARAELNCSFHIVLQKD